MRSGLSVNFFPVMNPEHPSSPDSGKSPAQNHLPRVAPLVATIIALGGSSPVEPLPSSFSRIQEKLGHRCKSPSPIVWLAAAGWAAAVVMAVWMLAHRTSSAPPAVSNAAAPAPTAADGGVSTRVQMPVSTQTLQQDPGSLADWPELPVDSHRNSPSTGGPVVMPMMPIPLAQLEPGVVAVTGTVPAPGVSAQVLPVAPIEEPKVRQVGELQAVIGVALAPGMVAAGVAHQDAGASAMQSGVETPPDQRPVMGPNTHATLVYDASAAAGQLLLKNLPSAGRDTVYRLYLTFAGETTPRLIGSVPASESQQNEVLSFKLARSGWLPTASYLTYEAAEQKPKFQPAYVVLQGVE